MSKLSLIFFITLVIVALRCHAKITLKEVKVDVDKDAAEVIYDYKTVDGKIQIAVNTTLKREIDDSTFVSASFSIMMDGTYTPVLRLEPVAICKVLNMEKKPAIMKFAMMMLKSFGEIPEKCPIAKGHYYVKDIELDENFMIPMMPSGDYHIEFLVQRKEGAAMKLVSKTILSVVIDQPE